MQNSKSVHTSNYLERIGVPDIPTSTIPFNPGYSDACELPTLGPVRLRI